MDDGGAKAKQQAGIWTYWTEWWVTIDGEYADDMLTVTFSNNTGNWYDTRLFYKHPGLVNGKMYKLTVEIDSNKGGRVTLHDQEFTIKEGKHDYDIVFTEDGGLSIFFTFGLSGQNNNQEIPAATMKFVIKGCEETQQTQLQAPSFSLSGDKVITIDDPNAQGVAKYELGFFQGDTLVETITVEDGDTIDPNIVVAGTYTLKLKAIAAAYSLYTNSEWSTTTAEITSTNENVISDMRNGGAADAAGSPDTWFEWHNQGWEPSYNWVTLTKCTTDSNGKIELAYSIEGNACWFSMQLFKKYSNCSAGNKYTVTMKINSSVAGKITVCGQVVELQVGDNDVQVTFTHGGQETIAIQFGVDAEGTMIQSGTFTITNIDVTAAEPKEEEPSPDYTIGSQPDYTTDCEEIIQSGKTDNQKKENTWLLWWVDGDGWQNCGTRVNMNEKNFNDGVNFTYTGGSVSFSVQLFYDNTELQSGTQYVLKCTIELSTDLVVTVNGKTMSLKAGSNDIEVLFTLGSPTGDGQPMYALDIQFWGSADSVSVSVSDVAWYVPNFD